jgi:hypothetical protein
MRFSFVVNAKADVVPGRLMDVKCINFIWLKNLGG